MFHLLAITTTKCKRQQIVILIISFFANVAGIRNEGNNMLLQQQQQQQTTIENSYNKSFRPSQLIDFTPADAALPQQFTPTYFGTPQSTNTNKAIQYNKHKNIHRNVSHKQETQSSNRRYAIEMATTYGNAAEKPFSFPNRQQQTPQHLTDNPIYVYRDPFTNENYHYTPTETYVKETTIPATYNHNNYNNDAYKQQNLQTHLQHYDDNQEYLVQSSMTVGMHQQQQLQHHQPEINSLRPYMSLSDDKDVYLKRPGFVYNDKPNYNLPNSVTIDKKNEVNKISYDSHDYPPPSYFQQQTSNFLPTPVPKKHPNSAPIVTSTAPPRSSPYQQNLRPSQPSYSTIFMKQQPQQQYSQSSLSVLPNYANSIDNYLLNKQQTSEYYRTETPPTQFVQQPQIPYQYENRPPPLEYDIQQQTQQPSNEQQYFSRPPPFNSAQIPYHEYESAGRPPPGRPSYNNYYGYQIGEIPPPSKHHLNYPYPYPRPPSTPQYPYRPPVPSTAQQSGLATLAQYAPQFTSLLLGGGGGTNSNNNGPLGSLIGALTGAAATQQSSPASSYSTSVNRRPLNSQLIKALENIARNDDLQCVPKVLCQMIAAQTQRGQLPTFITSPAITNFLTGFPAASPALIYGRASLLGLSGGLKSCHQTYIKCPKDEYEIIDYLNNHRGGFFKFFSEPEEHQQTVNHEPTQQAPTSLFSILSALAGPSQTPTTTVRPKPKPQAPAPAPATDITSGISNFFTQLLSDYVGGAEVEYQRSLKRRTKRSPDDKIRFEGQSEENYYKDNIKFKDETLESQKDVLNLKDQYFMDNENSREENEEDFHDEEDDKDTQQSFDFKYEQMDYDSSTQSRILHKNLRKDNIFFSDGENDNLDNIDVDEELKEKIKNYNDYNKERKLKFPTATDDRMYTEVSKDKSREGKFLTGSPFYENQNYGKQFTNYVENSFQSFEKENKKIKFVDYREAGEDGENPIQLLQQNYLEDHKNFNNNIIFPERQGKILNKFYYAPSYIRDYPREQQNRETYTGQNDELILPTSIYTDRPSSPSFNSLKTFSNISPNKGINNNIHDLRPNTNTKIKHFLPTPPPQESNSNSIPLNQNYNNKQNSVSKYPSYGSSYFSNHNVQKPEQLNFNRYHSSFYTTRHPYTSSTTTEKSDIKNIYVTNSRGVTEYYLTPDGKKIYL